MAELICHAARPFLGVLTMGDGVRPKPRLTQCLKHPMSIKRLLFDRKKRKTGPVTWPYLNCLSAIFRTR